jgi:hypothetical protein
MFLSIAVMARGNPLYRVCDGFLREGAREIEKIGQRVKR